MAACPPGSLDSEYLKGLGEVAQYLIQGDSLVLNFKLDSGGMTFTAAAAQPAQPSAVPGQDLGGKQWQWVKTNLNDGQTFNPSNPADYTIAFSMLDGKVAIKADCNNAVGEFMTDGQNLQIMIGGVTRAMCQPGSLSEEFLKELSELSAYQVQGDTLTLTTSSGTMTLTAGQAAVQPTAPTGPAAGLEGPTWQWINTAYSNSSTVASPDPAKYTLKFDQATKRFIFVADCNNGSGTYTVNGQNLTMQVQGMTRANCPSPSNEYIQMLDQAASYKIDGNTLSLLLKTDGTMTFTTGETQPASGASSSSAATPVASAGGGSAATPVASTGSNLQRLTSGVWKWQQSADSSGQTWTAPNPASYTIQFNPDGTLGVKVDCNTGGGSYQADETNLTIQLGATTLMACPPPTLDNEFRQQLGLVASYFFDGDNLVLLWKMDSGSMKFAQ
jgi:heat shock protein HslJ